MPRPRKQKPVDLYARLEDVLQRAYDQAASGKGHERHAQGMPFDRQPMQLISELINSPEGMRYQAIKKVQEAARLDHGHQVHEILGAINYLAGLVIYLENHEE